VRLPGSSPGPHRGHTRATNDRIAADNNGQHRPTVCRGPRAHSPTDRRSPRSPEISDTEEDGGSTPPAPTIPTLSRAFEDLFVPLIHGSVGENGPTVSRALNYLTEGVHFGAKPSPSAAIRLPSADPDVTRGPRPPPDRDACGQDASRQPHVTSTHLEHADGQTGCGRPACARSPRNEVDVAELAPPWDLCSQRWAVFSPSGDSSETSASNHRPHPYHRCAGGSQRRGTPHVSTQPRRWEALSRVGSWGVARSRVAQFLANFWHGLRRRLDRRRRPGAASPTGSSSPAARPPRPTSSNPRRRPRPHLRPRQPARREPGPPLLLHLPARGPAILPPRRHPRPRPDDAQDTMRLIHACCRAAGFASRPAAPPLA
jgi:hypothetical protein